MALLWHNAAATLVRDTESVDEHAKDSGLAYIYVISIILHIFTDPAVLHQG